LLSRGEHVEFSWLLFHGFVESLDFYRGFYRKDEVFFS
jgi:hypothetical protein